MTAGLETPSDENRDLLQLAAHPEWCAPMLATLTDGHFPDPDWIFERKLDGEHTLAFRDGARVRLLTRNRKELNATFSELVDAVAWQESGDGDVTSFLRLQARMQIKDAGSTDLLKFKCVKGHELVIDGFTAPKGNRVGFGALLVGYYDNDEALRYSGKVGTGFHDDFLCNLLESVPLFVSTGAFRRGAFFTPVKLGWP